MQQVVMQMIESNKEKIQSMENGTFQDHTDENILVRQSSKVTIDIESTSSNYNEIKLDDF
jgi:hypothetical protein